jgi:2-dehydropantoate 2-reductase
MRALDQEERMSELRVLIQGIGGVGGVLAGELLRAGHTPTLITGNPEIASAINQDGLRVTTPAGSFTARGQAFASPEELATDARFDLSLLVMKAQRVVEAARAALPHLTDDGYVVTCQNGIVEDAVGSAIGAERVVSCIVSFGATMLSPGEYEQTSNGEIHIGEPRRWFSPPRSPRPPR